jgi:hydrogenase maturation protease
MKEHKNKTLVLGLGNTLLGDDGVGIHAARRIAARRDEGSSCDVIEASLGGAGLLDVIAGYERLILVDAVVAGGERPAGTIHELSPDDLGATVRPYASHALDLKTTLQLGVELGYKMPGTVRIYAVEIEQQLELKEVLSTPVEEALQEVVRRVSSELGLSDKNVGT